MIPPRMDGMWSRKLDCVIYPWIDRGRNLAGHVYLNNTSGKGVIIYQAIKNDGMKVQSHRTSIHRVEDPEWVAGYRMDSTPDPDTDDEFGLATEVTKEWLDL